MNRIFVKNAANAANSDQLKNFFDIKQLRRMDNLSKLTLYCAAKVLRDEQIDFNIEKDDIGLIIATARGAINQTCNFMDSIIDDGDVLASPLAFSGSVHNALETTVTTLLNLRGACLTISQNENLFSSALITAKTWLYSKRCKTVLLGVVDESNPVILKEYGDKIIQKDCASFFLLTLDDLGKELVFEEKFDKFNPSYQAYTLAKKYSQILNKKDIEKMIADFTKTYLAARKKEIMSVFQDKNFEDLIKEITDEEKKEIIKGLKTLFLIDSEIEDFNNLVDTCFKSVRKNEKIVFATSGSTGKPKNSVHSQDNIKEEVEGVSFLFKDIKRIVSTVPTHHSYGFIFGLQLPKFLGLEVKYYPPMPIFEWNKILQEGDLLITFPLFLKHLADLDFKFPNNITILSSTAPCPDELIDKTYNNGAINLIEIYGSSEAGAIAYRQKAKEPFSLFPFWQYNKIGEIFRKSTTLKIEIPDNIEIAKERKFFILERKDHAVQVAGINVYPSKVEKILKNNELIKDVSVRLGKDRLKAFIVLNENIDKEKSQKIILDYMNKTLTAHEIPKNIVFGKEIPITTLGKKADW